MQSRQRKSRLKENFELFQPSATQSVEYQNKRVEGKRIFPSFLCTHPPTALHRAPLPSGQFRAEYVAAVSQKKASAVAPLQGLANDDEPRHTARKGARVSPFHERHQGRDTSARLRGCAISKKPPTPPEKGKGLRLFSHRHLPPHHTHRPMRGKMLSCVCEM